MLSSKYWITNCIILTILAFSTFATSLAYAAPLGNSGKDWQNVNGNSWAQNYSPQTQINKNNVGQLEIKWVFPLGGKNLAPKAIQSAGIGEEATAPPVVRDGTVFVSTNYMKTIALDAKTGKQLWTHDYVISVDDLKKRVPITFGSGVHKHGFQYWEGGDAILNFGLACDFYGLEANTGKEKFWVKDLCKDIPGNIGNYWSDLPNSQPHIGIYEKGKQFIYVLPGRAHRALISGGDARHVTMGIDMDSKNILWRVYSYPPYDQVSKDWALQECDIGYFNIYPCKEVAAKNKAGLEWDWTFPDQNPSKYGAVTANWGQLVVDEDTGILYTNTGNQGPYGNISLTPGPRLYGSTLMAIDMNAGKRVWWLQPFPHDPYDYDCNWSGILADNPTIGKVYIKGCKEGVFYVINAKTGKPVYSIDGVDEQLARGQIKALPSGIAQKYFRPDPFSQHDMREWGWISYPAREPGEKGEHFTLPFDLYPTWSNGFFATDMSLDPETQTLYQFQVAAGTTVLRERPAASIGQDTILVVRTPVANETIVARDVATGKIKWTWFFPSSYTRAHIVVSGGMVFTGFTDGQMRFFDKDTGKPLREINMGAPVLVGSTVGADSDGNSKIFTIVGATRSAGAPEYGLRGQSGVSGTLVAVGLSDASAKTVTSTTTSVSTIVSTQPPNTTTVTSQVTQTSGLPSEVTYAAVGVAIIAIAAAAVLVMRKK